MGEEGQVSTQQYYVVNQTLDLGHKKTKIYLVFPRAVKCLTKYALHTPKLSKQTSRIPS